MKIVLISLHFCSTEQHKLTIILCHLAESKNSGNIIEGLIFELSNYNMHIL